MTDLLQKLCSLDGVSSDEGAVREFIISQIEGFCDFKVDRIGNIIAFKKGSKQSKVKLMVDAHMDEVGFIITSITDEGFLKFKAVGGIDTAALMFRKVRINGSVMGAVSCKPVHLLTGDQKKKPESVDSLYIDIGASKREEAEALVSIGDFGVVCGDYQKIGDNIIAKAIDDRVGCAILIKLLRQESDYDFYATFSVQEEVGLRGARVAAFSNGPQSAIILEATTAADIAGVSQEDKVCQLGCGPAVSFMDKATVYDKAYYKKALSSGIKCQAKSAVAGGNNSGAVHLSGEGVRTIAISVPCRYIHTSSCVANDEDIQNTLTLCKYMINQICSGDIE